MESGKDVSDDEDPVVEEVDVYLSKQLAGTLFLLQYPVRPRGMTYDDSSILTSRFKPKQQRMELEVGIDTEGPNYAKSKGEQIAINVDGRDESGEGMFHSSCMDKQILSSNATGMDTKKYVAGYLKDKELHITPLTGVIQLRPGFSYLDAADSKQKAAEAGDVSQDEENEAKPVTVRYAKRETEEAKARRLASFENVKKRQDEEPWTFVHHHSIYESDSNYQLGRLLAQQNNDVDEFQNTPQKYLEKLLPKVVETEEKKPPMPNNVLSLAELKTMSLGDQVKALLINAKVMHFSQLMSLLTKGTDPTAALRCLQQSAVLVQGCWVVQSDILYPKDTFSAHSGVPAESLCRARDYVLWRYTQSRIVVRKDISTVVKIPAEDVKDILEQIAQLKVSKGWEFVLEFDGDFVNRNPEVVQRQQMLWDAKFTQLCQSLKISRADLERKAKSEQQAFVANSPTEKARRRRTSSTRSRSKSCSMSDFSDQDGDAVNSTRSRRQSGQARSRRQSGATSGDRTRRLSSKEMSINIKQEKPDPINNGTMQTSVSTEMKKELVTFVYDKLTSRGVVTMGELKQMLTYKLANCPPGHIFSTGVSEYMLKQTIFDIGAKEINDFKETVYALTKFGDKRDPYRTLILELIGKSPSKSTSVRNFKKAIDEAGFDMLEVDELKQIIQQYCSMKKNYWQLKCVFDIDK